MNKVQAIHAQPPTLVALVHFTLVSLGLGVVANFAGHKGTFLKKYQRPDTGLETRGKSRCRMLLTGLHLRKIFWRKSFSGNNLQHLQKTSAF